MDALTAATTARARARSGEAREIRLRAGAALAEVGKGSGASAVSVSRWERGLSRPTGDHAVAYGRVLDRLAKAVMM